mmetsp:Transcript_7373/g.18328  ORF Transcript_7373/g.18328 Transcript_7373/m.18328 type:complete len:311 (+) Transcript_7373:1742-2674(+)
MSCWQAEAPAGALVVAASAASPPADSSLSACSASILSSRSSHSRSARCTAATVMGGRPSALGRGDTSAAEASAPSEAGSEATTSEETHGCAASQCMRAWVKRVIAGGASACCLLRHAKRRRHQAGRGRAAATASANATAAASFSSSEACAAAGGVTALGGGGKKADMPAISTQIASACSASHRRCIAGSELSLCGATRRVEKSRSSSCARSSAARDCDVRDCSAAASAFEPGGGGGASWAAASMAQRAERRRWRARRRIAQIAATRSRLACCALRSRERSCTHRESRQSRVSFLSSTARGCHASVTCCGV